MREFELKKLRDKTPGQDESDFGYRDVLITILTSGPAQGLTVGEMRRRIRCVDALESADGIVQLEDADFDVLYKAVEGHRWPRVFVSALRLWEDLNGAHENDQ